MLWHQSQVDDFQFDLLKMISLGKSLQAFTGQANHYKLPFSCGSTKLDAIVPLASVGELEARCVSQANASGLHAELSLSGW